MNIPGNGVLGNSGSLLVHELRVALYTVCAHEYQPMVNNVAGAQAGEMLSVAGNQGMDYLARSVCAGPFDSRLRRFAQADPIFQTRPEQRAFSDMVRGWGLH